MKTCHACGYHSNVSGPCPRCGAELERTPFEQFLYLYTNTWTFAVVGCVGVLGLTLVGALAWFLTRL